ncbi:MAG: helix-turn-helix domain-containing protein [Clostridia bacterium]|nr:helix-turn-helix domain-containing protein [Clostridia bacterium]
MPRDKSASHARIVPAARAEFLQYGFENASMRRIAQAAGMTSAGLYRHFADKEGMFAALVEPALAQLQAWYEAHKALDYRLLDDLKLDDLWEGDTEVRLMREIVYPNFDAFKLLVCRSEGTRYANFLHELVMLEQRETELFMDEMRRRGLPVKDIRPEELHLLLSAYVSAIFEVVVHDFAQEDAVHYLGTLQAFFIPGWRAVLGF